MSQSSRLDQQILMGEDYVEIWVESFLRERKAQNLTKGTVRYYRENLKRFVEYLSSQQYLRQL